MSEIGNWKLAWLSETSEATRVARRTACEKDNGKNFGGTKDRSSPGLGWLSISQADFRLPISGVLFAPALLDAGGAAAEAAEVVEAGATDFAAANDFDLFDAGRVEHEGALDADAAGNLTDSESRCG